MPEFDKVIELAQGPFGALIVLILLVTLLVSDRLVTKGRLEDEKAARAEATEGWRQQSAATGKTAEANERLAAALEERNRLDRELLERHPK